MKKQGKRNRQAGARFELKVRKDLEEKGWIVDRWGNNVEIGELKFIKNEHELKLIEENDNVKTYDSGDVYEQSTKLVPAKRGRFNLSTTGFPDFLAYRDAETLMPVYYVTGVECKTNGYLKPEEKQKCQWLLDNNIFAKIFIAQKGEKRGTILYKDFTDY